ncbi:hypothetical protein A9Q99_14990 [Gammaproteobacteria bacterium 45_16_T64]|nr:hypothetical protein A9Q99_14990 [Gammaproteobacteria bacterium 45_16_T64]
MEKLTGKTDHFVFLHSLQSAGLTGDWLPFNQSEWIREVLHGGLPTRSRFATGICNEMSVWMMTKWVKEGPSSQYISQLNSSTVAQTIVDYADGRDSAPGSVQSDYDYFAYLMSRQHIGTSHQSMVYDATSKAFADVKNLGNCGICMHPSGAGDGHTIICNAKYNCVFDPNLGFIRTKHAADLEIVLNTIANTRYPELTKGIIGVVNCK